MSNNKNGDNGSGKSLVSNGEADLYLDQYNFTTTAALVGSVDRKIFVLLRDGRNLFGVLRTYDQFANLTLEDTTEIIYVENEKTGEIIQYGEAELGTFMIRGENVVYLGELDIDKEDKPLERYERIPFEQAQQYLENSNKRLLIENHRKKEFYIQKGLTYEYHGNGMY
ncbi:SM-like, degradation of cytoplasmic mRNAs and positively regulates transcription initiation [Hanseniaspora vineae]